MQTAFTKGPKNAEPALTAHSFICNQRRVTWNLSPRLFSASQAWVMCQTGFLCHHYFHLKHTGESWEIIRLQESLILSRLFPSLFHFQENLHWISSKVYESTIPSPVSALKVNFLPFISSQFVLKEPRFELLMSLLHSPWEFLRWDRSSFLLILQVRFRNRLADFLSISVFGSALKIH